MAKILTDLLLIIFSVFVSLWFYWHNQQIILTTDEYRIRISYLAVVLIFISLFIVSYRFINLLSWLKTAPKNLYLRYQNKNNQNIDLMIVDLLASNISCGPELSFEKAKKLSSYIGDNKKYYSVNVLCKYVIASNFISDQKLEEANKIIKNLMNEPNCQYFSHLLMAKLKIAKKLYSEAAEYIKILLENDYKTKELINLATQLYIETNDINKLEEIVRKANQYNFISIADANNILENSYFSRARDFFSMGKIDESSVLLKKILKLNLSHQQASILYIQILIMQKEPNIAWQIIEKTFKYSPSRQVCDLLIEIFHDKQTMKEKIEILNKINPNSIFPQLTYLKFLIKYNKTENSSDKSDTKIEIEKLLNNLPETISFSHRDIILYLLDNFN